MNRRYGVLCAALAFDGCATSGVDLHRIPPETPAADNAAAIQRAVAVANSKEASRSVLQSGAVTAPPRTEVDAPAVQTYDPWERLNRFDYRCNARVDEAVFLPVANGYRRIPSPFRTGVHHFFGNLSEVDSVINYTLQGRLRRGARSLSRLAINSTIGIGGLFDVATKLRIEAAPTGFGTTLSLWGMHPGPFLVIPFFGPSRLREAVGLIGDGGVSYGINLASLYRGDQSWGLGALNAVDNRSNVGFRYYSTGSPFEYDTIRFLYVRRVLIEDEGVHGGGARGPGIPEFPGGE